MGLSVKVVILDDDYAAAKGRSEHNIPLTKLGILCCISTKL